MSFLLTYIDEHYQNYLEFLYYSSFYNFDVLYIRTKINVFLVFVFFHLLNNKSLCMYTFSLLFFSIIVF